MDNNNALNNNDFQIIVAPNADQQNNQNIQLANEISGYLVAPQHGNTYLSEYFCNPNVRRNGMTIKQMFNLQTPEQIKEHIETLFTVVLVEQIDAVKEHIDSIYDPKSEKSIIRTPFGHEYTLNRIEMYIIHQNDYSQNLLHSTISAFNNHPKRLTIIFSLINTLKKYIGYSVWFHLCFKQDTFTVSNANGQFHQFTAFQMLYTMRTPLIIGSYDDYFRKYSSYQACIEAIAPYNKYAFRDEMTEEQKIRESNVIKQLMIAQYILQKISHKLANNSYAITIWEFSPQTITEIVMGETENIKFYFPQNGQFGWLSNYNQEISQMLSRVITDSICSDVINYNTIDHQFKFDKGQRLTGFIIKMIGDRFQDYQMANKHPLAINQDFLQKVQWIKKEDRRVNKNTDNKPQQQRQRKMTQVEQDSLEYMLNTSNIHKKTYKNNNDNDNRSNIKICKVCEIRRSDDNNQQTNDNEQPQNLITEFKGMKWQDLLEMFETNAMSIASKNQPTIDMTKFLVWMFNNRITDSETKYSYTFESINNLFSEGSVIFSLRFWLIQNMNTTWTFRLYNMELHLNVIMFMVFIGVPLMITTNFLSVDKSSEGELYEKMCDKNYDEHFKLLRKLDVKVFIKFIQICQGLQGRNEIIDLSNLIFVQYFREDQDISNNMPADMFKLFEQVFDNRASLNEFINDNQELIQSQLEECGKFVEGKTEKSRYGVPDLKKVQLACYDEYRLQELHNIREHFIHLLLKRKLKDVIFFIEIYQHEKHQPEIQKNTQNEQNKDEQKQNNKNDRDNQRNNEQKNHKNEHNKNYKNNNQKNNKYNRNNKNEKYNKRM